MSETLKHPQYAAAIKAANLTPKQKLVLDLWLNGHSLRRIALAHGWSESNARHHLDAAIRKIRPHMPRKDEAA
jgi:DNA-binding CsgD family transcriptional regulator